MRAIRLTLSAFGSFPGTETVDFTEVGRDGLFLVTGATGTGKSTLFDAMCWALYGEIPRMGTQRGTVRSHHVEETTRCEVTFRFGVGDEVYEVTRNPDQQRPGKHGTKFVREPAHADLVRIDGSDTTPITAKTTPVTKACEAIIGLTALQFQRVVLLPQGDFSAFLRADSGTREELLAKLFDAQRYDDIVDHLKVDADALATEVGDTEGRLAAKIAEASGACARGREVLEDASPEVPADASPDDDAVSVADGTTDDAGAEVDPETRDDVAAALLQLDGVIAERRAHVATLAEEAARASQRRHDVEAAADRFTRASELREELDQLDARVDAVDVLRGQLTGAAEARPVVIADDTFQAAQTGHERARDAFDTRVGALRDAFGKLDATVDTETPVGFTAAHAELVADLDSQHQTLQRLDDARRADQDARDALAAVRADQATAQADRDAAVAARATLEQERTDLAADRVDPEVVEAEITALRARRKLRVELETTLEAEARTQEAADAAEAQVKAVFAAFVAAQAPLLAASLVPDEPCPVCGSTTHPDPAASDADHSVGEDEVEAARTANADAQKVLDETRGRVVALTGQLGDEVGRSVADWDADIARAGARHDEAVAAATRFAAIETELAAAAERLEVMTGRVATLGERLTGAEQAAGDASATLQAAIGGAEGIDAAALARLRAVADEIATHLDGFETLAQNHDATQSALEERRRDRDACLDASPFPTVDAARAAHIDDATVEAAKRDVEAHDSARSRAQTRLADLEAQGIPDDAPEVADAVAVDEAARATHDTARDRVTAAQTSADAARAALDEHDRAAAEGADLRVRHDRARKAYQVCRNGGSHVPMSLKRWVLSRELDRITAVANVHLGVMTAGRYALQRRRDVADARRAFGLDLDVFDAHTSASRSPLTLSGGEQFQASLALALGLADVIARGGSGSGHHFESLFVDEGFGSLDQQALDVAVSALVSLQDTGRMVGAITHVESMKDSLPGGIEVRRLRGGGSTLALL